LLAKAKHYFLGSGAGSSLLNPVSTHLTAGSEGKEYQTDALDSDGTTVLRRTANTWQAGSPIAANPNAEINDRIADTTITVDPTTANLVSKETFSYDQYNNRTDEYEYDFGSGSAGSLVRHSATSYLTTQGGSDYACDAVSAGCEILRAVKGLNDELAAKGRAPIQIGIGIHSGPAIVGSVGSPQRLEFTAIGNTVNVASRIQGLTKTVGRPLLVTEAVRDRAADSFTFEELPPQEVRGIEGRVMIFAVRV